MDTTHRILYKPPFSEPSKELDELAHKVIGAAIEVHRALWPGYTQNAMRRRSASRSATGTSRLKGK